MPQTYESALRTLTGEPKLASELIDMFNLGMLAGGVIDPAAFLGWFDATSEAIPIMRKLVAGVTRRIDGTARAERDSVIHSAHATIVALSYIEVATNVLNQHCGDQKWKKSVTGWVRDQNRIRSRMREAGAEVPPAPKLVDWQGVLFVAPPNPLRGLTQVEAEVGQTANGIGHQLLQFIRGLEVWDRLNETQRHRLVRDLTTDYPRNVIRTYRTNFMRLASDVNEFFVWANLTSARHLENLLNQVSEATISIEPAVVDKLNQVAHVLATPGTALSIITDLRNLAAAPERAALQPQKLQSLLREPLLALSDMALPDDLRIPFVGDGYVEPQFKMAILETHDAAAAADDGSWDGLPSRRQLGPMLYGLIQDADCTSSPIVILGEPGSGKSLLSQLLTERFDDEQVLAIRVVMRTAASTSPLDMIDETCRRHTNGAQDWRQVCASTAERHKVLVFDGLDELLQNSGTREAETFLLAIADFQAREAQLGSPTAVVVTCRTTSMRSLRIPPRTVALRLMPFEDEELQEWIQNWNALNTAYYTANARDELDLEGLSSLAKITGQPLLLLLAAIYHATEDPTTLRTVAEAQAYRLLFKSFLRREYCKIARPEVPERIYVQEMLGALTSVATYMYSSGRKFITEDEDSAVDSASRQLGNAELEADSSVIRRALNRFYFIYRSEAMVADSTRKSFEFLHSTFGEALVACAIADALRGNEGANEEGAGVFPQAIGLLGLRSLTSERRVYDYLDELLKYDVPSLEVLVADLSRLPWTRSDPKIVERSQSFVGYVREIAMLSVNAIVLAARLSGGSITLNADHGWTRESWESAVRLWQSGLSPMEFDDVLRGVHAEFSEEGVRLVLNPNAMWDALTRACPASLSRSLQNAELLADLTDATDNALALRAWRSVRSDVERGGNLNDSAAYDHIAILRVGGGKALAGSGRNPEDVLRSTLHKAPASAERASSFVLDMRYWETSLLSAFVGELNGPKGGRGSHLSFRDAAVLAHELHRRRMQGELNSILKRVSFSMQGVPAREDWAAFAQLISLARSAGLQSDVRSRFFRTLPMLGLETEFATLLGRDSLLWLYGGIIPRRNRSLWKGE